MSEENTVEVSDVNKALETLQDLAKGHSSRGTATTNVETMRDGGVGAGSDAGSTQVFHTPSNSDPGTWAGTGQRRSPEDGATDGISEDGTDYSGSAEMVKSVLAKAAQGLPLDAIEKAVLAQIAKGYGSKEDDDEDVKKAKKDEDEDKDDKDDKKDMPFGKSLEDAASENEDVAKGLEVSSFLAGWVNTQSEALQGVETRLNKSLGGMITEQREYQLELAKGLAGFAEVVALQAQRIEQIESTPARGPKSAVAIEKSFGAGGEVAPEGDTLSKAQAIETMISMVEDNKLSATEVVKLESTGVLSPEVGSAIHAYRSGRNK